MACLFGKYWYSEPTLTPAASATRTVVKRWAPSRSRIDLVLLDGHKPLYPRVLDLVESRLRKGACLVADNVDASPLYLARVRAEGGAYLSVPFAGDVELSIKV